MAPPPSAAAESPVPVSSAPADTESAAGIAPADTESAAGIGLDFGTTNSALAVVSRDGRARLCTFASEVGPTPSFRSVLFFGRDETGRIESVAGPGAIARYLEADDVRRLVQSPKSFLASRLFDHTQVLGRRFSLADLIGRIVRGLLGETDIDPAALPVVVGRPVRFVRAEDEADDTFAEERLRQALAQAGLEHVRFELEPVAAAWHYTQALEREQVVLIADFGGGTSDFCLLRVGPPRADAPAGPRGEVLGTSGVGLAGDAFGARLVRHVVAPQLGLGTRHRTVFGRSLPVPVWVYNDLERWHHLSFLNNRRTLSLLAEVRKGAVEPERIDALLHVIQADLGFELYRSVERTKLELSAGERSHFRFDDPPVRIEAEVLRSEFERWIEPELRAIADCVDGLLGRHGLAPGDVGRVFLTGGSSFVPAVRAIFAQRFGAERIRTGEELTSIASGLALSALRG